METTVPAAIRRSRMLAVVNEQGFARVTDLSERFSVSHVTVRNDLDVLERHGQVRRVHGGAVSGATPTLERPFEEAERDLAGAKSAIARFTAGLISTGETVIMDVGTTTTAVARALVQRPDLRDVTVFTNALNIALELEQAGPRFMVVVTGGTLRAMQHSLVDPFGTSIIERINAGTVIIGCNGVDGTAGVTNINLPEADMKRAMVAAGRRRIVVADGSKIGEVTLARVCGIEDVGLLVTDRSADPEILADLIDRGLDVEVAG